MRDNRGLSTVVTMLIVILLVLVAIGIIWVVVKNLVTETSEEIGTLADCPFIELKVMKIENCDADGCDVTVKRESGGPVINGVRVVVTDGSESSSVDGLALGVAETKSYTANQGDLVLTAPAQVEASAVVFFEDDEGNKEYCSNPATLTFDVECLVDSDCTSPDTCVANVCVAS